MTRRPIDPGISDGAAQDEDSTQAVRDAFALWSTGVSVVAVRDDTGVHGLTVSAFMPLSLHPPLILLSLAGDAPVLSYIEGARRFVVNILGQAQRPLASRFADRFPIAPGVFPASGDPVLPGALAAFVCTLDTTHQGGDHRIVIGRVERVERHAGMPLLYHERAYRSLG